METRTFNIKNTISNGIQLLTTCLLIYTTLIITQQKKEIELLHTKIDEINTETGNLSSEIRNLEYKLDDVESEILSGMEDVERTVRIWSN